MDRHHTGPRFDEKCDIMTGRGISYGAITVINAMVCGIGCTIGTGLRTEAVFSDRSDMRIVSILNDPGEDTAMARICVRRAFEYAGVEEPEGWSLTTDSEIPISRGLKSSSSACNAILSAVFDHLGTDIDSMDLIRLGVSCAREAGVTVTGSFDDACGCHLGGLVMTDNRADTVLMSTDIDDMDVVIYVPEQKIRKNDLRTDGLDAISDRVRSLAQSAVSDPLGTMTENGRLFAGVFGVDDSFADRCLSSGALAAGMTGAGPAIAVLTERDKGPYVVPTDIRGRIIITRTRHRV